MSRGSRALAVGAAMGVSGGGHGTGHARRRAGPARQSGAAALPSAALAVLADDATVFATSQQADAAAARVLIREGRAAGDSRLREVVADCQLLSRLQQDVGFPCQSTALVVTPQAPVVARRMGEIVARPGLLDPLLEAWAIGLLGEIAVNRGDDAEGCAPGGAPGP